MKDSAIERGARQAVVHCVRVTAGEKVVVVTDRQTETLADALIRQIGRQGGQARKFVMEDLGARPAEGASPLVFDDSIAQAMTSSQASFYIAQCKRGELASFRRPMLATVERHRLRHAHMPGFTEQMMSEGMASDYSQIQALSRRVYEVVRPARQIRVTTGAGTDLVARFDPAIRWVVSDGLITPDQWMNLPDGEVFTSPVTAEGRVVVDGCFGDFFSEKYGLVGKTPLQYDLKDGRAIRKTVRCDNKALEQDFIRYTFETDENSNRLGEFAIGTNTGLTGLIGNLLQDEKFPGIHLALGSPYPTKTGATWDSSAHNDGILLRPTITVEDRTIMRDGQFLI
jgi:leucyl aminopeptidase (aminopeptidase T)